MYEIETFVTFPVCMEELFLICTYVYRTSKGCFQLHSSKDIILTREML